MFSQYNISILSLAPLEAFLLSEDTVKPCKTLLLEYEYGLYVYAVEPISNFTSQEDIFVLSNFLFNVRIEMSNAG